MSEATTSTQHDDSSSSRERRTISPRQLVFLLGSIIALGVIGLVVLFLATQSRPVDLDPFPSDADSSAIIAYAGSFTLGDTPLSNPKGIFFADDLIYVADSENARIVVLDTTGVVQDEIELAHATGALTAYPVDVCAADGRIVAVDTAASRVIMLEPDADGWSDRRIGQDAISEPTAVTCSDTEIYVFDAVDSEIEVLDMDGVWQRSVSPDIDPELLRVTGMAVSSDVLYVSDSNASRIVSLSAETGEAVTVFGEGLALPRGVAVDASGRIWVTDVFGALIAAYDAAGTELLGPEQGDSRFAGASPKLERPEGVAVDSEGNLLFLTDAGPGVINVYNLR